MEAWLALAIAAQFIFAVTVLVDKHIVVRAAHIGRPIVYAFYVGVLSGVVIVLAPFGVSLPSTVVFWLSFVSGVTFLVAVYCMYNAFTVARASDVAPVVGALSAITVLGFAWFFLEGDIHLSVVPAVVLLVLGTVLISRFHFRGNALPLALLSGSSLGISVFFTKLAFIEVGFIDGFFWTRMLACVAALSFLGIPSVRTAIFQGTKRSSNGSKLLVIGNKALGGTASIMMAYAVSLGSVAIVNALSGLQFVFLFIFAFLFAKQMPKLADSAGTHGHGGWQTGIGVALIVSGLALIYLLNSDV